MWLIMRRLSARLMTFLLMVFLARGLGSEGFGKFAFANSFCLLLLPLSDLGIMHLMTREVARHRETGDSYVGNLLSLKLVLSVLAFLIIGISAQVVRLSEDTILVVYLIGGTVILRSIGDFYGAVFQAYERMHYLALIEFLPKVVLLGSCLYLIFFDYGLIAVGVAYVGSGLLYLAMSMGMVYSNILTPRFSASPAFWKDNIIEAFPFAAVTAISLIYYNIDIVMLGRIKGEVQAGWYGASYHLYYSLTTVTGAFLAAAFPAMARLYVESVDVLTKAYHKAFRTVMGVAIPVFLGGMVFSDQIIETILGPQYAPSAKTLRIFSFIVIFSYMNGLAGYLLTAVNQQKMILKIMVITTLMNIALNLILIPKYGDVGAAYATAVSEIGFYAIFLLKVDMAFRYFPVAKILKSLFCGAVMIAAAWPLTRWNLHIAVIIAAGAIVYTGLAWVTGYVENDEKRRIKELFARKG